MTATTYTFSVPIGDWSGDGHEKFNTYYVRTTTDLTTLHENVKRAQEQLGIDIYRDFAPDYGEPCITLNTYNKLLNAGMTLLDQFNVREGEPKAVYVGSDDIFRMVMFVYGYGLDNFTWEQIEIIPDGSLIGWGTPVLGAGYGTFVF